MASLFLDENSQTTTVARERSISRNSCAEKPEDYFFAERVLGLVLIGLVALWLRAQFPGFTTAYMDESVYVVYGRMYLAKHFEAPLDTPLRWSFGWYLWPVLSALADRVGGIVAVRELSAAMGSAAVFAVYGFAKRLFNTAVALGAAAIFAVAGPAVMASRIATRDSGAIFFFSFALWAFARAWQTNERRAWLASAACLFGAFLCKYIVVIYVPFLMLIALRKGWRAVLSFLMPILAALAGYLVFYWPDLRHLLLYGGGYNSLRASGSQLWDVYVTRRVELWAVAALALLAFAVRGRRLVTLLLWLGALTGAAFQWKTRADFDFWKHATYPLIFLVPLAAYVIVSAAKRIGKTLTNQTAFALAGTMLLASCVAWTGLSAAYDRVVFWPNVEPILAYFEGQLHSDSKLLIDDSVLRYYFHPQLRQSQMVDPFHFRYKDAEGAFAYQQAVEDGVFDYIILDGGMGAEAKVMQSAINGHLQNYTLRLEMPDPTLGQKIEIYERTPSMTPILSDNTQSVEILSPAAGSAVENVSYVRGKAIGVGAGWYVRLEIFTDRWYSLGKLALGQDDTFQSSVTFAGEGRQGCHQILRARLYDDENHPRAVSVIFNVKRSNLKCDNQ